MSVWTSVNPFDTDDSQTPEDALRRLLAVARRDTGQSRRVADFLLAWWDASRHGGFDLTEVWGCDLQIRKDMLTVFIHIASNDGDHADHFGLADEFGELVDRWRCGEQSA